MGEIKIKNFFYSKLRFSFQWASELSSHLVNIHDDEIIRRQKFESVFEQHFLNALFVGLDDLPPAFATQAPNLFDNRLPKLSKCGK